MAKDTLTFTQELDIALIKCNLTQADVVTALCESGIPMNTSKFSVQKKYNDFTEKELNGINKILKTNFSK